MRKWMDKGAAKAEGGTPAPRGVLTWTDHYDYVLALECVVFDALSILLLARLIVQFCSLASVVVVCRRLSGL